MPDARTHPLEPTPDEMRVMLEHVTDRIVEHIESLAEQPASYDSDGRAVASALAEEPPARGTDLAPLLDQIFDEAEDLTVAAVSQDVEELEIALLFDQPEHRPLVGAAG